MLRNYPEDHQAYFDRNRSYNHDLNKLEISYLDVYMSQISSKSVHQFEKSKMCSTKIVI